MNARRPSVRLYYQQPAGPAIPDAARVTFRAVPLVVYRILSNWVVFFRSGSVGSQAPRQASLVKCHAISLPE
jgi:hypothetical protein